MHEHGKLEPSEEHVKKRHHKKPHTHTYTHIHIYRHAGEKENIRKDIMFGRKARKFYVTFSSDAHKGHSRRFSFSAIEDPFSLGLLFV